jgi:spore germination protein YaaH
VPSTLPPKPARLVVGPIPESRLGRRVGRRLGLVAFVVGCMVAIGASFPVVASELRPQETQTGRVTQASGVAHATAQRQSLPRQSAVVGTPSNEAAADPAASTDASNGGLEPTIQYEDALVHAHDRIRFSAGQRVSVPYRPRAGDGWLIDGSAPQVLPSGTSTGRTLRKASNGAGRSRAGSGAAARPQFDEPLNVPFAPAEATSATTSTLSPASEPAPDASSGLRRQVFGFLPYWELADSSTVLDYDVLSTIAYFSVGADSRGNLLRRNADGTTSTGWAGWTSSQLTGVVDQAHTHGTRVVLTVSVFAWTANQASIQKALLGSSTARLNLARQAAAAVRARGADGINLDFEPIATGYADEFTAFVRTLRQQLNAIHTGYQLTFDTMGSIGNYPIEAATATGGADAIFVMGYDYRTSASTRVGSIDPIAGPAYDITDTILSYLARVPASRVILGVPYSGRAWSTTSGALNATNVSGTKYGTSTSVVYGTAAILLAEHGRRWDPMEQVAWAAYKRQNCTTTFGCVTAWRQLYVDDVAALKAKYDLVNRYHLRGVGMWALGYDGTRPELYRALASKFLADTTAPLAGVAILPTASHDEGILVRWTASDDVAVAATDVQVSIDGGSWRPWLTGTALRWEVYPGRTGHAYAFRVRARDNSGNWSAWNVSTVAGPARLAPGGFGRVVQDGLAMRRAADSSALRLMTLAAGDVLAITGGPISADGYTWYRVTGPLHEWQSVGFTQIGGWVAASGQGSVFLAARGAPNATSVSAGISDFSFAGAGPASIGTSVTATVARAFSPNGDGREDGLRIDWTNRRSFDSLNLIVYRADGSRIGAIGLGNRRDVGGHALMWNGVVGSSRLSDGVYVLRLVGVDGSTTYSAPSSNPVTPGQIAAFAVTIDRTPPTVVAAGVTGSPFSPNGDRIRDSVTGTIAGGGGAISWSVAISPVSVTGSVGAVVRTLSGVGATGAFTWNGRTVAGLVARDGRYRLTLAPRDAAGNIATRSFDIVLDTRGPAIVQTAAPGSFSPNGDGVAERTVLGWTSSEAAGGKVTIKRGTTVIRTWSFTPRRAWSATWTGTDRFGHRLADGRYTVIVDGRDQAGNRTVHTAAVLVDRTAGYLRWNPTRFDAADGDRLAAKARVGFTLTRSARTTLRIVDSHGTLVRTAWSGRTLASGAWSWTWNGTNGSGALVPAGRYVAVLTATSSLGTTELSRTIVDDAFVVSPSPASPTAGQTLTLAIRSVEALGAAPRVTFAQHGLAAVTKTANAIGNGLYRVAFVVARAGSGDAIVTVRGRDTLGGTNVSRTLIRVR